MVYLVVQLQDKGKTLSSIIIALKLLGKGAVNEIHSNVGIRLKGDRRVKNYSNAELREYMKQMVSEGYGKKCIVCDEVDRVFPPRFWSDKEQTMNLIGLFQDEKLKNHVLFTGHKGLPADKIIRDATRMVIMPEIDKVNDLMIMNIWDERYQVPYQNVIKNVSYFYQVYDRWMVIK